MIQSFNLSEKWNVVVSNVLKSARTVENKNICSLFLQLLH